MMMENWKSNHKLMSWALERKKIEITLDDELGSKAITTTTTTNISFPNEIIQEILSRLPIKPLLRFTSVSKEWLSFISHDPSFRELHFTRSLTAKRTALLISVFESATRERHFLSAPPDGGPLTHVITLEDAPSFDTVHKTEAQHLNGLVLYASNALPVECSFAFIINPATHKVFKLPLPTKDTGLVCCSYFFGFHQSRNEHCVLSIMVPYPQATITKFGEPIDMDNIKPNSIECMIYSLSAYSWRKIEVEEDEFPFDITGKQWCYSPIPSLCVNSVIHLMLKTYNKILAFDLTIERFSTIDIPPNAISHETYAAWNHSKVNHPYPIDIKGCLGLVCHGRRMERNEMSLWILQDYDSCVWVKEIVTFPESWKFLNTMYQVDSVVNMDKIVFPVQRLSWNRVIVPIYDMKTKGFKLVPFSLSRQVLPFSLIMEFGDVKSYVESILPLEKNEEGLHEDDK